MVAQYGFSNQVFGWINFKLYLNFNVSPVEERRRERLQSITNCNAICTIKFVTG